MAFNEKFIVMGNSEYHAHHALGSSDVRRLMISPLHLKGREEPAVRPSYFTFGSAVHTAFLEPEKFAHEYRVKPAEVDGNGPRTKYYREWMAEQPPCEWMGVEDYDKALKCVESLLSHPISNKAFDNSVVEGSLFFSLGGVECKARPDLVRETSRGVEVIDIKTTTDASPKGFAKSVGNLGYHIQEWFYRQALEENGMKVKRFIFLAVEKQSPYACAAYVIRNSQVVQAEEQVMRAISRYRKAESEGVWDGYPTEVTSISVPSWALPSQNGNRSSANWVGISDAMSEVAVSRGTIYNWIKSGAVEAKRIGGRRFVSAKDLSRMRI